MLGEIIVVVAAGVGILATGVQAGRWLVTHRRQLEVTLTFGSVAAKEPGSPNPRVATVKVRNSGSRPVVLMEFGIMRCETSGSGEPQMVTARGNIFEGGDRLEPDDVREARFEIDGLPAEHEGRRLGLWAYGLISGTDRRFHDGPLIVKDLRRGSPTYGQEVLP